VAVQWRLSGCFDIVRGIGFQPLLNSHKAVEFEVGDAVWLLVTMLSSLDVTTLPRLFINFPTFSDIAENIVTVFISQDLTPVSDAG
jgi:hypothetical protein